MTAHDARQLCQAYLDGQIAPHDKAEIERLLKSDAGLRAYFDEQRGLHNLLHLRAADVEPPPGLDAAICARLRAAQGRSLKSAATPESGANDAPSSPPVRPELREVPVTKRPTRQTWLYAAAGVLLSAGLVTLLLNYMASLREECPYMVACIQEHRGLLEGSIAYAQKSSDTTQLAAWIGQQVNEPLKALPDGSGLNLTPKGSGAVSFKELKQYGAPDGVFVFYECPQNNHVTLLLQRWPEETPEDFNRLVHEGQTYWATEHKGFGVASWKSPDDKLVLSVITKRSKNETLKVATAMRQILDSQIQRQAALKSTASNVVFNGCCFH